jgi:hypothetical protein
VYVLGCSLQQQTAQLIDPFVQQPVVEEVVPSDIPFEHSPEEQKAWREYAKMRMGCLDYYHFGSVQIAADSHADRYQPGDTVHVEGDIINQNEYPLPDGMVTVRVHREDASVAGRDWHPIVAEMTVPGTYSIPSRGRTRFAFDWTIPKRAPGGSYFIEFSYLAGGRYVMGGIPYIANFPAGSAHFAVEEGDRPLSVMFDRSSVVLNGEPLSLRSVPPSFDPGQPITVEAQLNTQAATEIPASIRVSLHEWSDMDMEAPLIDEITDVTLKPGEPLTVPLAWIDAKPGVYELVLSAIPLEPDGLPSVLKVRFPINGDVPRLIYAGVGKIDEAAGEVTITTCTLNGTAGGKGIGSVDVTLTSDDREIETRNGEVAPILSALNFTVPLSSLGGSIEVAAVIKDPDGTVTDRHQMRYATDTLESGLREAAPPPPLSAPEIDDEEVSEETPGDMPEEIIVPDVVSTPVEKPIVKCLIPLSWDWLFNIFGGSGESTSSSALQ